MDGTNDTPKAIEINNDGILPPTPAGPPLSLRTNKVIESTNNDSITSKPVELPIVMKNLQITMKDLYQDENEVLKISKNYF